MAKTVSYACYCNTGRVRKINQDNFWVSGMFLNSKNNALRNVIIGEERIADRPAYAVFDGMGGEKHGEIAAYLAAANFNEIMKNSRENAAECLNKGCLTMNSAICRFMADNGVRSMGTTAAIIMFEPKKMTVCNLGDSGIFRLNGNSLTKLSTDHVDSGSAFSRKPMLTQFLGIPPEEYLIEPSIKELEYKKGDRFLICSDGLTDMLSAEEIAQVMQFRSIEFAVSTLVDRAILRGGVDNTTVIICEVG